MDYFVGGADSIYTQLMPSEFARGIRPLDNFSHYNSRISLLISLEALETGSYQYLEDGFGNRIDIDEVVKDFLSDDFFRNWSQEEMSRLRAQLLEESKNVDYAHRLNILEFARKLACAKEDEWDALMGHEVMLKERLAPRYFEGIWVDDETTNSGLLS